MRRVAPGAIDFAALVRPGDTVLFAECASEPLSLAEVFLAQRYALTDVSVFVGMGLAGTFRAEHADAIRFHSYGALGTTRRLADAAVLDIVPVSMGRIPRLLAARRMVFDVVMIALPPPRPDGRYSLGLTALYLRDAIHHARVVIAEVSSALPTLRGISVGPEDIDVIVPSDRAPPELAVHPPDDVARRIAGHIAPYVEDGATLQLGVGSVPEALTCLIGDRRDLGIHSGLLSKGLAGLIERGAATGARKSRKPGIATIGSVMGDAALYRFVERNAAIELAGVDETHLGAIEQDNMVAVNGALSVDLQGQVNGEMAGSRFVGAIGGQPDFARAAAQAPGGRSIIALNASPGDGSASGITARPLARVSTPRTDVDVVATQFGAAELQGCDEAERRRRLIAIADPRHRDALERGII